MTPLWPFFLALLLFFVFLGFRYRMHVAAIVMGVPRPLHRVRLERDVIITMRDGVKLIADLYMPKTLGKYPAILTRTPYEKRDLDHKYPFLGQLFASQGYVCVIQDTRGKHQSGGDFYPFAHEEADGCDTVAWVCEQEWSNGKVGTFGASYLGLTQWLSAPSVGPALRAMVPIFISQRAYDIVRGRHGVLHYKDSLVWHYLNQHRNKLKDDKLDWDKALRHLPVSEADEAIGKRLPCYRDWITHAELDGYWGQWRTDKKVAHIQCPALIVAGWFDRFVNFSIEDYQRMRKDGGDLARRSQLVIGPWAHEPGQKFPDFKLGRNSGPWQQLTLVVNWFDRWVKGVENGVDDLLPVLYYLLGANEWRRASDWPLPDTDYQRFYLHQGGSLDPEHCQKEETSQFIYDPEDPVPSIGGNGVYAEGECGPRLQTAIELRDDVLTFSTEPLLEDLTVVGSVSVHLYASTSAVDTDFAVKLCDVDRGGRSINLKGGIIRARYRHSLREPELLTPGKPELFEIHIGAVGNLFKKGHRIRLQVSSSCFPEYSRNLNVEEDPHYATKGIVAQQTIYHDSERPSYLRLPVSPC